jgi:ribose transport system permease protein
MTYTAWAFIVVALVLWFVIARSRFGRHVYASGGNAEAARLSGLLVGRIRTATFVLSGLAAGLAGVLSASRIGDGQSDAGTNLQVTALTAVFIGGTSLSGGSGSVWRTIVGVFLLTLINNGFDLLGINPIYETVVQGLIILVAVSADAWSRRSSATGVTA